MATTKPDLSAGPTGGVQNVVVYVSNDNFAQAYTVGQNVVNNNNNNTNHNGNYTNTSQSMAATVVNSNKTYQIDNKQQQQHLLKSNDYQNNGQLVDHQHHHHQHHQPQQQSGYFTGVISQNGFPQPIVNNLNYVKSYSGNSSANDVLLSSSSDRQSGPGRPTTTPTTDLKVRTDECDNNNDTFIDSTYVTVVGATDGPPQSVVRCDSVRSETAESSCSSLSSADDSGGMVVVHNHQQQQQQPNEMVVYDSSVSVRPGGGVVLTVGPPSTQQQQHTNNQQQPSISVPFGWKRILNNGSIIYISPSNTALSSLEQVKEYLLTAGTCKCGLECHFKYDTTFNFDPKVVSKPWTLSPDTNTGDLTKLCNHKRKIITMASLDCKPPDPAIKLRKDCNLKKTKRKFGIPYTGCVSVSQILAQREKLALNQNFKQDQQQQIWPQSPTSGRLQGYIENAQNQQHIVRYQHHHPPNHHLHHHHHHHQNQQQDQSNRILSGSPLIVGDSSAVMVQQNQTTAASTTTNISQSLTSTTATASASPNVQIQHQHIIGPNGQVISVQGPINPNQVPSNNQQPINHVVNTSMIANPNNSVVIQGQNVISNQSNPHQQHRIFINNQPNEPSGPGRPNIQMIPVGVTNHHQQQQQQRQDIQNRMQQFYNNPPPLPPPPPPPQYQQIQQQYDGPKQIRPQFVSSNNQIMNGCRPQTILNPQNNQIVQGPIMINNQQKLQWNNRIQATNQQMVVAAAANQQQQQQNNYERVPPLHQHQPQTNLWHDEIKRKKVKLSKIVKNRPYQMMECQSIVHPPCPNIDVRQIPNENTSNRSVIINHMPANNQSASPSFMEDPSGYLAQQTALLNSTINRQTAMNGGCTGMLCNSPNLQPNSQINEVPLPSNVVISNMKQPIRTNQNLIKTQQQQQQNILIPQQQYNQMLAQHSIAADSSVINEHLQCQGCVTTDLQSNQFIIKDTNHKLTHSRPNSQPGTPSSSGTIDDPVTSSTYSSEKQMNLSPDSRPIQGGTVSTSNVSPLDSGGSQSDPPTPNPTPPQTTNNNNNNNVSFTVYGQSREICSTNYQNQKDCCTLPITVSKITSPFTSGIVTTMASGRTVSSNTITSVLAGRTNTATVSVNSPSSMPSSSTPTSVNQLSSSTSSSSIQTHPITINVSKSPLEMVQSVVSSIQVPPNSQQSSPQISPSSTLIKHSPTNLPPGHILVSSGGQLIMANTTNQSSSGGGGGNNVMPPPPAPKIVSNQATSMPPISVSPMITNVTAAVSQVIPAVAQQVLGQQTVLVNALPTPFVLQSGVTMTMDGMTAATLGQNMQLPQLVTGNVIQQQIQIDNSDVRRNTAALLSPEIKKKGKKRKVSSQTVANMLHIAAAQQNSGVVMQQQGFPQQLQMAHSPQGITTAPVMQALTIVPSKTGGPPQIVMNGQTNPQLITNSQPTQQINLLQPVNLINGTTGVVQNFPTIQQFIVPNLGGMVMNPDGTATILQDTSNIGMQLQLQNVNGQNVLTPVQNNGVFNSGQSILASPAGMVIRTPSTTHGKILQQQQHQHHHQQHQQQHSPGAATAQFLSPNGGQFVVNGAQFNGQLSPLIASVSPSQHVTQIRSNSIQQQQQPQQQHQQQHHQQEFVQCGQSGQTLMVPCTPNIAVSSSNQNTTFVQQNTTIVQQQTTMVSNNQQLQQQQQQQSNQNNLGRTTTLNVDQNFIISSNDNKQVQALLVQQQQQQRESPQNSYRQSVSTQTAVNQNTQAVTTNTFCQTSSTLSAGSPPDTTTHSPLASSSSSSASSSGGQSPPTVDTTTHSGSTDDGLSPAPSNCSATCDSGGNTTTTTTGRQLSCMAMVHCISSSEPDSADLNTSTTAIDQDWSRISINLQQHQPQQQQQQQQQQPQQQQKTSEITDVSGQIHHHHFIKKSTPTHLAYAESSTVVTGLQQFLNDQQTKAQEAVVSSHNFDKILQKRKNSDTLLIMETHQMHSSLFDDDDDNKINNETTTTRETIVDDDDDDDDDNDNVGNDGRGRRDKNNKFVIGDLVWGPLNTYSSWPGKIIEINNDLIQVKWFGNDKLITKLNKNKLQTLSEGLDAHHRARKKCRTSRKLSSQLENAIQEAMAELDKDLEKDNNTKRTKSKKTTTTTNRLKKQYQIIGPTSK